MKYITLLLLFFVPSVVFGCSLTQDADRFKTPEENVSKYDHIFVATVADKDQQMFGEDTTYTMRVSTDISGSVPDLIAMTSPGHSCGSFFEEGLELLIMSNSFSEIDEITPQYYFQTDTERDITIANVMQVYKSINSPRETEPVDFIEPTSGPGDNFIEPTTPPPVTVQNTQSGGLLNRIFESVHSFFRGLFSWNSL